MAKQVRETAAGKSISAWIVLNKKGKHVATVNAYYPNGGGCSVDVWNLGNEAANNCWHAAIKSGKLSIHGVAKALADCTKKRDWVSEDERQQWAAFDLFGMQQSSGSTLESALMGLIIDGKYLFDHCGKDDQTDRMLTKYKSDMAALHGQWLHDKDEQVKGADNKWREKAYGIGANFTNYNGGRAGSLFYYGGLERLQRMGYSVIQAI